MLSIVVLLIGLCGSAAFLPFGKNIFLSRVRQRGPLGILRPVGVLSASKDNNQLSFTEILANEYQEDDTDYLSLTPDDPRFARMEVPSSSGPLAKAYVRHMEWRHSLDEHDRKICVVYCLE